MNKIKHLPIYGVFLLVLFSVPTSLSAQCVQNAIFVVTNTSLDSPLSGPFQSGEEVEFCVEIDYSSSENCAWLHGVVPTFGMAWDPSSFAPNGAPLMTTLPPGANWGWHPNGVVLYNDLSGGPVGPGQAVGAGWFVTGVTPNPFPPTCPSGSEFTDPNCSWGHPMPCNTQLDFQFCFTLIAQIDLDCSTGNALDASIGIETFTDNETGAWISFSCQGDTTFSTNYNVECCSQPSLICLSDQTIDCIENIALDSSLVTINSTCTGMLSAAEPILISGSANCPGAIYEVSYLYEVNSDLSASCVQTLTIENSAPLLSCLPGEMVTCREDIMALPSDLTVQTACGRDYDLQITGPNLQSGTENCPGAVYRYYYQVTDACGRLAVCTRDFTIMDDNPILFCGIDVTVNCEEDIKIDPLNINYSSSCEIGTEVSSSMQIEGIPNCPNTRYIVTYDVLDDCGRSASCEEVWTIQNDPPSITNCAPSKEVECTSQIVAEPESIEYFSSCGDSLQTTVEAPIALDNLGQCPGAQYAITYILTDACDRSISCTQVFTIANEAPRVFPAENPTVNCRAAVQPNWDNVDIELDCQQEVVRREIFGPIEGVYDDCEEQKITYLYSVWDACGRMTSVPQTWTIQPIELSLEQLPMDITVSCPDSIGIDSSLLVASAGCDKLSISFQDSIRFIDSSNYQISRTYWAISECSDSISASQNIWVECDKNLVERIDEIRLNKEARVLGQKNYPIYPNPGTDWLFIDLSAADQALRISIIAANGQVYWQKRITVNDELPRQVSLEIKDWPAGVYWVHFQGANQNQVELFLKP